MTHQRALIPLAQHPLNNTPSTLMNPTSRPGREIFQHGFVFVATLDGLAFVETFPSIDAARTAQEAHTIPA